MSPAPSKYLISTRAHISLVPWIDSRNNHQALRWLFFCLSPQAIAVSTWTHNLTIFHLHCLMSNMDTPITPLCRCYLYKTNLNFPLVTVTMGWHSGVQAVINNSPIIVEWRDPWFRERVCVIPFTLHKIILFLGPTLHGRCAHFVDEETETQRDSIPRGVLQIQNHVLPDSTTLHYLFLSVAELSSPQVVLQKVCDLVPSSIYCYP